MVYQYWSSSKARCFLYWNRKC